MPKYSTALGVGLSLALSLAGLAGFILLFAGRMTFFGIIIAPVIFAVYQIPAVVVYALWKKKNRKDLIEPEISEEPPSEETGKIDANID